MNASIVSITDKEFKVLGAIVNSQYHDCSGPEVIGNGVWTEQLDVEDEVKGMSRHQIAGTLASLKAKGLAHTDGTGRDGTVWVTEDGYTTYTAFKEWNA